MAKAVLSSRKNSGWSQIKDAPYGYVEVMHSDRPGLPLGMISYHEPLNCTRWLVSLNNPLETFLSCDAILRLKHLHEHGDLDDYDFSQESWNVSEVPE